MKKILFNIWKIYKSFKEYIEGDFAYENYLKHHKKNHSEEALLDKKSFLKDAQKKKWNKINRCC
ncbi:MAG: YbdD/YjiX family protein [Pelagibacterales bacterium]|nr:YbdD/YjiX family protein [Pelagibacterales bacterium]